MIDVQPISEDAELSLRRVDGAGSRLVVIFGGANVDPTTPLQVEFIKTASHGGRNPLLFVQDMKCSWFTRPGLIDRIVEGIEAEAARIGATEVVGLGNSMGGFACLIFPRFTPMARVLAISPQVSMDHAVITETRYDEFRPDFGATYPVSNAADLLEGTPTEYTVIFGTASAEDQAQAALLPADLPNLRLSNSARPGHGIAKAIKQWGLMDPLIRSVMYDHPRRLDSVIGRIEKHLGRKGWQQGPERAVAR